MPDIEFLLKTTADTTGAEEVEKSIFAAEDAAKQASRQADVDIAKGKQAAAVQREQADSLAKLAEGQKRIVAAQLADAIGKVAEQFKGLSPEVDLAIASSQNFLNTFATTGDPIKALFALTATAIGGVVTAYREADEQIKEIAKTEQENLKNIAEMRRAYAAQLRAENTAAFYEREATAIERQVAGLESLARITGAQRAAGAAVQDNFGAGQTPEQKIQADSARELAEIDAKVKLAADVADRLLSAANLASANAQIAVTTKGEDDPNSEALVAAAQTAAQAAEAAKFAAEEIAQIAASEKIALAAETAGKFRDLAADVGEDITKNAQDVVSKIREIQGPLEADIKGSLDVLVKLLGDSIPDSQQTAELAQAMRIAAGSRNAFNAGLSGYFNESAAFQKETTAVVLGYRAEISELRSQISTLQQ